MKKCIKLFTGVVCLLGFQGEKQGTGELVNITDTGYPRYINSKISRISNQIYVSMSSN